MRPRQEGALSEIKSRAERIVSRIDLKAVTET